MRFLKSLVAIIFLVIIFDLIINQIIPENLKKRIGTTKNYSLKSIKFHHETAPNINLYEFWGKKKYKVKTNQYSMRINEKENFFIDKLKENIGFVGDSFVYGSGIDYNDHFISKLDNKNYNFLNLGYVSYSPSIYYKKIKSLIEDEKIDFKKIFIFIDHSDVQDEGIFYRENINGNIVRKWINDNEVKSKNRKYKIKNFFKQNSFIFKLYENLFSSKISKKSKECITKIKNGVRYENYIDLDRFGYGYNFNLQNKDWIEDGINKIINYLNKIKKLSIENNFEIIIVNYPSALEVINNIPSNNSEHFKFLKKWTSENKIRFIDTRIDFIKENNINDYVNNFILCDVHWNSNGHKIISKNIKKYLNE